MAEHTERVMITDALAWDCVEGECEHSDEADVGMWENCLKITVEVCVDCMDERGHGRDQKFWEELVAHTAPPQPEPEQEPAILKPAAEHEAHGLCWCVDVLHCAGDVMCRGECGFAPLADDMNRRGE